jgi:hypothetical protein
MYKKLYPLLGNTVSYFTGLGLSIGGSVTECVSYETAKTVDLEVEKNNCETEVKTVPKFQKKKAQNRGIYFLLEYWIIIYYFLKKDILTRFSTSGFFH